MEPTDNEVRELRKINEKDRLELIEKKVEIQKKRLEIKREKLSIERIILEKEKEHLELADKQIAIQNKRIENRRAEMDIEELLINRNFESDRVLNDKIFSVLMSLVAKTIDSDRTILGSEPFLKPIIEDERREIVLNKLIDLIKKI
ncbi:MAG: hypothetical protein MUF36_00730 [Bacteroidales bacterium]|jgi:hypothetical protein|nr:hypothetical protein [Bacteroidales bacterium]